MLIWLQEVDDTCRDGLRADAIQCDHTECFPGDPEEAARIGALLDVDGQAYVGGGAAQLYLLTIVADRSLATIGDVPCPVCGGVNEGNTCCSPAEPIGADDDVDDGDYIAARFEERSYSDIMRDGMDE